MSYIRNEENLLIELKHQIQFLRSSCKAYDDGVLAEAKRLSVALRIILFDPTNVKSKSHSLLQQLNVKNNILFHSVTEMVQGNPIIYDSLTKVPFNLYVPKTSNIKVKLLFQEWWDQPLLINNVQNVRLTRGSTIRGMADQDGGAHIDPGLDGDYGKISKLNGMDWIVVVDGIEKNIDQSPESVIIRQTAYEILDTFEQQLPGLFPGFSF